MYKKRKLSWLKSQSNLRFPRLLWLTVLLLLTGIGLGSGQQASLFAQEISSLPAVGELDAAPANQGQPWTMHFWAAPGTDGTSLFVETGQTSNLGTTIAGQAVGPTGEGKFGMSYDENDSTYSGLISAIFMPGSSIVEGQVGLSAELDGQTFDTGPISFRRFSLSSMRGASPIVSDDNLMEMSITNGSLDADAYVVVMATNGLPGNLPAGYQLVGQPYSVRPSGADFISNNPLLLKLFYNNTILGDVDAHTLSILEWNSAAGQWTDLGGTLDNLIENSLSTTTERFTVYGLASAPRWLDQFTNLSGLDTYENTTVLLPGGDLVLNGLSLTGTAVSRPITPSSAIKEWTWGTLSFTREVPNGTSLTIDVLDGNDNVLLSDVSSDTSLASFDPALYPSLKLRANFSTNDQNNTPRLGEWSINWEVTNSATPTPEAPTATATAAATPTATPTPMATATLTAETPITETPIAQTPIAQTPTATPTAETPADFSQIYLPLLLSR